MPVLEDNQANDGQLWLTVVTLKCGTVLIGLIDRAIHLDQRWFGGAISSPDEQG